MDWGTGPLAGGMEANPPLIIDVILEIGTSSHTSQLNIHREGGSCSTKTRKQECSCVSKKKRHLVQVRFPQSVMEE